MDSTNKKLYEQGGLSTGSAKADPVSGNPIPPGSVAKEVRDDIPAMLSENEYVVPADVVKYYGVNFFEGLRDKAKSGLDDMASNGRIGGTPVPEGNADMAVPPGMGNTKPVMANEGVLAGNAPTAEDVTKGAGSFRPKDFSTVGGTLFGSPSQAPDGIVTFETYVNANTGMQRVIPFVDGQLQNPADSEFTSPPFYKLGSAQLATAKKDQTTAQERIDDRGGPDPDDTSDPSVSISAMDASQVADAYSGLAGAKTAVKGFGMLAGPQASAISGLLGLGIRGYENSLESRAEALGIDLSTVTRGEDLNRSNFTSDDAFNSAMESVAPTGMSFDPTDGSYTGHGLGGKDGTGGVTDARGVQTGFQPGSRATQAPPSRPGSTSSSQSSSTSGGKSFGDAISDAVSAIGDALGFGGNTSNSGNSSSGSSSSSSSAPGPNNGPDMNQGGFVSKRSKKTNKRKK